MRAAKYFVQAQDDLLAAYWNRDVLLADIAHRKDDPPKRIWVQVPGGLTQTYRPITVEELRGRAPCCDGLIVPCPLHSQTCDESSEGKGTV